MYFFRKQPINKKDKRKSSKERESSSHSTKLSNLESQSAQYNTSHKTDPLLSEDDGALRSVVIVPSSSSTSKPEAGHTNNSHKRHR